jgi:hypothetical protein
LPHQGGQSLTTLNGERLGMETLLDLLTSLPFWVGFLPGFALGIWQMHRFMVARARKGQWPFDSMPELPPESR